MYGLRGFRFGSVDHARKWVMCPMGVMCLMLSLLVVILHSVSEGETIDNLFTLLTTPD